MTLDSLPGRTTVDAPNKILGHFLTESSFTDQGYF